MDRAITPPVGLVGLLFTDIRGTYWIRPELIAQIGVAGWTNEGRLRQPRFPGLRDDKRPSEDLLERTR